MTDSGASPAATGSQCRAVRPSATERLSKGHNKTMSSSNVCRPASLKRPQPAEQQHPLPAMSRVFNVMLGGAVCPSPHFIGLECTFS